MIKSSGQSSLTNNWRGLNKSRLPALTTALLIGTFPMLVLDNLVLLERSKLIMVALHTGACVLLLIITFRGEQGALIGVVVSEGLELGDLFGCVHVVFRQLLY